MARTRVAFTAVCLLSALVAACGGGASSGGGGSNSTITSVSAIASPSSITTAQTATCTATVVGAGAYSSGVTWTATGGTITSSGVLTPTAAGTATCTATSTQDSTKSGSATVTVTTVPITVTNVSMVCNPSSITDIQTTSCTPTVVGTGVFANTVNLSVSPSTAGTLSTTSNVSSGTAVTFTPAGTGAATATITATSTQSGYTNVSGSATVTVTLRTITVNSATGNIWLANCAGIVLYTATQTGAIKGDVFHVDPYLPATFTSTPTSSFTVSLGIGDTGTSNVCSPGAYSEYIAGAVDSAVSNTHYVPVVGHWNMWAGYNTTDEFQSDPASDVVCKFKLTDSSADGCIATYGGPFAATVDGNYLVASSLGSGGFDVRSVTTGSSVGGTNRSGDVITGITAKNGIVGYTQSTKQMVSFSNYSQSVPVISDITVGTAPAAIAMSTGCSSDPNTASAFVYDEEGTTVYRIDGIKASSGSNVTPTKIGSVALTGFSPASQLKTTLARFVVAWDNSCKAAILAPVVTGTSSYSIEVALVDMTSGNMHQIGTYVSDAKIPANAIRFAADPTGGDVIIASTTESTGTTSLVKVSWTLDSSENPTFTTTTLASAPSVGIYGVSLGVLPNGKISIGQRQQHAVLANQ